MKVRSDLFLKRQSLMHSPTFIYVYETTDESETARIWPRGHVQSLEIRDHAIAWRPTKDSADKWRYSIRSSDLANDGSVPYDSNVTRSIPTSPAGPSSS